MGILSKKEVKRPMQVVGKMDYVQWYTDDNTIWINGQAMHSIISSYIQAGFMDKERDLKYIYDSIPKDFMPMGPFLHQIFLLKIPDLFEYALVYLELPEPVENLLIVHYKGMIKNKALIQDKINQKRKKLL